MRRENAVGRVDHDEMPRGTELQKRQSGRYVLSVWKNLVHSDYCNESLTSSRSSTTKVSSYDGKHGLLDA